MIRILVVIILVARVWGLGLAWSRNGFGLRKKGGITSAVSAVSAVIDPCGRLAPYPWLLHASFKCQNRSPKL